MGLKMIHFFSMSGTHLIRASKQSLAIRLAVAYHLGDILGYAVDPDGLVMAMEAFYGYMDGGAVRNDDIDLIEVIGSGVARVNSKLVWSKKMMPASKILKIDFLEKMPTDKGDKDAWTIKAVIDGETISLVDSGCNTMEVFTMEEAEAEQTGIACVTPSRRRKITVPEELRPGATVQGQDEEIKGQDGQAEGDGPPGGESKVDLDSNLMSGLMEGIQKLEVNPEVEREYDEHDVTMLSTQPTVIRAPVGTGQGPFGDIIGSFRTQPDLFDTSRDADVTRESLSNGGGSDQQVSGGEPYTVTLVPSKLQTDGVPRKAMSPRDGGSDFPELGTPIERKIPAPMLQPAGVPSQYYSLLESDTIDAEQWRCQVAGRVQSTAVKKRNALPAEDLVDTRSEQLPRFAQPVQNPGGADKILDVTYGNQGHFDVTSNGKEKANNAKMLDGLQVQPAHRVPHVKPTPQRQTIVSNQSDDWLDYEKQKLKSQRPEPAARTAAVEYTSRLTPTPEDLPSSYQKNDQQVFMMQGMEPSSNGRIQSIPRRSEPIQGQMYGHQGQPPCRQDQRLNHQMQPSDLQASMLSQQGQPSGFEGQIQKPQGHNNLQGRHNPQGRLPMRQGQNSILVQQGQSSSLDGRIQNPQGRLQEHQNNIFGHQEHLAKHPVRISDPQGQLAGRQGQSSDHQDQSQDSQYRNQSQALAQDLTVADLSKIVTEMARNTKPKEQQMRIQSSVQYPNFDPSSEDDAEMAICSLSVLRDLGYNTAALVIGFCYQNSLSELLLALTPRQKTDFNAFAAEFRRWYGVNPATAQAQYDRLRQKPGENEIALYERISQNLSKKTSHQQKHSTFSGLSSYR